MLAPAGGSRLSFNLFSLAIACFLFAVPSFPARPSKELPNSSATIAELKSRAEHGDLVAQQQIGEFLIDANPASPGYALALDWLRSLAAKNQSHARFILGYLYEKGRGVPQDYVLAAANYHVSALYGYDLAQNNLARLYRHGLGVPRDLSRAFNLYRAAAEEGNRVAEFNLATLYVDGTGVPRDLVQAARWLGTAADQGYPAAQHTLALAYFEGRGVPVDYFKAAHWDRLAAQQGDVEAETDLAYFYETGKGVPLDYVSAYAWYTRSIAAGEKSGVSRLKSLSQIMTRRQLEQAQTLAAAPLPPASTPFADRMATGNSTTAPGN